MSAGPRIVYLHGDSSTGDGMPDLDRGWVARLHADLERHGFPTFFERLPDAADFRAGPWKSFLEERVRVTESDVLLGWSRGAVAALRMAEEWRVRGLVLVAPYFTDAALEGAGAGRVASANWDRIRRHTRSIAMFHSDDDPCVSQGAFAALASNLNAEVHVIRGAGHFTEQESFPELSAHLLDVYG